MVGDKLLCVTRQIRIYGTADGDELSSDDVLSEVILKNAALLAHSSSTEGFPLMFGAGMEQDDVLYVNTDGIYTHSMGGSVSEQLYRESVSEGGNAVCLPCHGGGKGYSFTCRWF